MKNHDALRKNNVNSKLLKSECSARWALLIRGPGIRVPSSAPKSNEESQDSSWDFPFSGALHTFCTPAGKPCFSLHCLHSVHRGRTCRGKAPPSCWRKTVLSLKSPTGAFIAALRSQMRIFHTFFQANSRRVNSRRCSGFICRTTFSIPSGVIWMLSGRFSFTGAEPDLREPMSCE